MEQTLKEFEINVNKAVSDLKAELISLRGNRPTAMLVEDIKVEAYGQKMPLKQLASISIAPPREIAVSLWDKSLSSAVSKAIEEAIEISPVADSGILRVNLPTLTEERRHDLIKSAGKLAEEAKIKIRSFRDAINKKIAEEEGAGSISEDSKFRYKEKAQKIVDEANKKVESLLEDKVAEFKE